MESAPPATHLPRVKFELLEILHRLFVVSRSHHDAVMAAQSLLEIDAACAAHAGSLEQIKGRAVTSERCAMLMELVALGATLGGDVRSTGCSR